MGFVITVVPDRDVSRFDRINVVVIHCRGSLKLSFQISVYRSQLSFFFFFLEILA